jgi:hypothetical protein
MGPRAPIHTEEAPTATPDKMIWERRHGCGSQLEQHVERPHRKIDHWIDVLNSRRRLRHARLSGLQCPDLRNNLRIGRPPQLNRLFKSWDHRPTIPARTLAVPRLTASDGVPDRFCSPCKAAVEAPRRSGGSRSEAGAGAFLGRRSPGPLLRSREISRHEPSNDAAPRPRASDDWVDRG